jgi:UDP-N-acetylglucosamine transferase subunit ALG13
MTEVPGPEAASAKPNLFVAVGTTDFDALIKTIDTSGWIRGYTGTFQIGRGLYTPTNLPHIDFAPSLDPYYDAADVVVAHGGLAITMEVLRRGKPLVSVSNDDRRDGHQDDLLAELEGSGHLVWCRDLTTLGQAIEKALSVEMAPIAEPVVRIDDVIEEFLRRPPKRRLRLIKSLLSLR